MPATSNPAWNVCTLRLTSQAPSEQLCLQALVLSCIAQCPFASLIGREVDSCERHIHQDLWKHGTG